MSTTHTDFGWQTTAPGNGHSGGALAQFLVDRIRRLDHVADICDLGCGNGHLSGQLSAQGFRLTGIDGSATGIRLARQTYPNVTFVEELIDRNMTARANLGDFDLVVSSDVIEHLYRPADLIEAALSVLRPGGQILIGTPYHGYLKNLALSLSGKMDSHFSVLHTGGHIKFFSVHTLSELIQSYGFKDLSFSFYGRAPYLWKNMICHARRA